MSSAQDIAQLVLIVGIGFGTAVNGLGSHLFTKRSTTLVNPHIARCGAGDEVATPGMSKLVACSHVASGVISGTHAGGDQGDVLRMFHGAHGGGDIPYPLPSIGAEASLEHGHHPVQHFKMSNNIGAVVIYKTKGCGISLMLSSEGGLYDIPWSRGYRRDVGWDGLAKPPLFGKAAVAVGCAGLQHAAAQRPPSRLGSDDIGVGGLVMEVVTARVETTPIVMGIFPESGTQVIINTIVHMHAPETV